MSTEGPYERGEAILLEGVWADDDGTPIDPVVPRVELTHPDGSETVFLEADLTVVSQGILERGFTIPDEDASEGRWVHRWSSTGPKPKAETQTFQVLKPQ